jgi:two-component system response regulator AtoC
MAEIAIIDDEKVLVNSLRIGLSKKGFTVHPFYEAKPFLGYLNSNEPDVVFLDLQLPDIHGLEVLRTIKQTNRHIPTIIITAHGNIQSAVQAMKTGAFDYISKPFELEEIEILIKRALSEIRLVSEIEHHRARSYRTVRLENIIGKSPAMLELYETVKKLTAIDTTTVLIRGESGTGKDLLARAIHNLSARAAKQFIEINCAALPEHLLESELFGYEKGAFTDAKQRKTGLVEIADGGTLYLDEVAEIPLSLQAKLLKFIETKSFRRVGGTSEILVNLFILASTNRNLEQAVASGTFRHDLYYRLNVVPLFVPVLRERGEDVIKIAQHYLEYFSHKFKRTRISLSENAQEAFLTYDWPGNVRELKNLIERLVILSNNEVITYEQLPTEMKKRIIDLKAKDRMADFESMMKPYHHGNLSLDKILEQFEEELIRSALKEARGVKSEAAKILGISRYALLRRMKRIPIGDV